MRTGHQLVAEHVALHHAKLSTFATSRLTSMPPGAAARGRRDGFGERLADDAEGRRGARSLRRGARGAGAQRPPHARRDVPLRRVGRRPRRAGDHRRRRRRRSPTGHVGGEDHRPGARRARRVEAPPRTGLAALDRADARRRPRRHVRDRRGRGDERRAVRRRPAGERRPCACAPPSRRTAPSDVEQAAGSVLGAAAPT